MTFWDVLASKYACDPDFMGTLTFASCDTKRAYVGLYETERDLGGEMVWIKEVLRFGDLGDRIAIRRLRVYPGPSDMFLGLLSLKPGRDKSLLKLDDESVRKMDKEYEMEFVEAYFVDPKEIRELTGRCARVG